MATSLVINGITFLSTREAARKARVSHDYIARLAREERVEAIQSGRRWYVDPVSLERFVTANEIEKQARSACLRAERHAEQAAHDILHAHSQRSPLSAGAKLQALAILFVGLVVGQTALQTWQAPAVQGVVAQVWSTSAAHRPQMVVVDETSGTTRSPQNKVVYETTIAPNTMVSDRYESRSFVLVGTQAQADNRDYLQSLFSDTVTVQYMADGRGQIVPQLADGAGEAVEFLLVPNDGVVTPPPPR
jgi:hypothetical protein